MTTAHPAPVSTRPGEPVWPVAVPAETAVRTVARRLSPGAELTAQLYHHPFLGVTFLLDPREHRSWWPRTPPPAPTALVAAVAVDLVSGRAFLTDPWDPDDLVERDTALAEAPRYGVAQGSAPRSPAPRVTEEDAVEAARALLPGLLARRRRLETLSPAELTGPPVHFGKPNWWVTGRSGGRDVQVVVDALSGRHYVRAG